VSFDLLDLEQQRKCFHYTKLQPLWAADNHRKGKRAQRSIKDVNLTHKISLDATFKQRHYFARAAGTSRFVYNHALAEWNRQYSAGGRPTANALKLQFNATYKELWPWIEDVHRDCHSQPFADLGKAFGNFFKGLAKRPVFKKRGKSRASFYVANDKFSVRGNTVRLPVIGKVKMREALRFTGKINSARVVEECGQWFICISVDVGEFSKPRTGDSVVGVDVGVKVLATLDTGEQIENPRPLKKAQKRLRRANRKLARRVKGSANRNKQRQVVARIHRRIRNIRHDVLHKFTSRLAKNHGTVVIEDLNVKGMVKNHCLAQAISDAGFGMFRQFLGYKVVIHGTRIVVADRFYPSSKMCSRCGRVKSELSLSERVFICECGNVIDRDWNAALNLKQLGAASPEVTPVESSWGDSEAGTTPRADSRLLTR
jgi:putative transposase